MTPTSRSRPSGASTSGRAGRRMNPMRAHPARASRLARPRCARCSRCSASSSASGAIVALVSVAQGATSGITNLIEGLGTNLISVSPGATTPGSSAGPLGRPTRSRSPMRRRSPGSTTSTRSPRRSRPVAVVVAGDRNTTTTVSGITPRVPEGPRLRHPARRVHHRVPPTRPACGSPSSAPPPPRRSSSMSPPWARTSSWAACRSA